MTGSEENRGLPFSLLKFRTVNILMAFSLSMETGEVI